MQVQHVQFRQCLQIFDLLDVIFTEHQYAKSGYRVQVVDLLNVIVVKVQEYQVGQTDQVFNPRDQIVLQIQKSEPFFAFE